MQKAKEPELAFYSSVMALWASWDSRLLTIAFANRHIMLNAPVFVQSIKLVTLPGQYLDGCFRQALNNQIIRITPVNCDTEWQQLEALSIISEQF